VDRPPSVIYGVDGVVLKVLFALHAPPNPKVLDTTYGKGVMWRLLPIQPWRNDISPGVEADTHYDCRRLPADWTSRWDVLVFDPPHLSDIGVNARMAKDGNRYGLRDNNGLSLFEDDIVVLFSQFAAEAQRVLAPGGVIFAKIKDSVHANRFRWLSHDFKTAVEQIGMTCCAPIIKVDPHAGKITGANWGQVVHPRTYHTWWLTVHNGPSCVAAENRRLATNPLVPA
jgi:hypothetical protein